MKTTMFLTVKVITKSSKSEIVGFKDNKLIIKLKSVPEKNKANTELIKLLKKLLKINSSDIQIISGQTKRIKRIEISGLAKRNLENIINN